MPTVKWRKLEVNTMNEKGELDPKTRKANLRLALILALVAVGLYVLMVVMSQR